MELWEQWLSARWSYLVAGQEIDATWQVPHPSTAGFTRTDLAEGHGQLVDWELAVTDGSRIHVHEFADGRLVVHRDAINPSRGPLEAMMHWFSESALGKAVFVTGSVALIGVAVALVGGGGKRKNGAKR